MSVLKPRRREDVVFREVGPDEAFLYDPVRRCVHALNASAVLVWLLSDGTREPADIAAELADHFAVPANTSVREDVDSVLENFQSLHVLSSAGLPA